MAGEVTDDGFFVTYTFESDPVKSYGLYTDNGRLKRTLDHIAAVYTSETQAHELPLTIVVMRNKSGRVVLRRTIHSIT
jgi:hypothetical protein